MNLGIARVGDIERVKRWSTRFSFISEVKKSSHTADASCTSINSGEGREDETAKFACSDEEDDVCL